MEGLNLNIDFDKLPCVDCITFAVCKNKICVDNYIILEYLYACEIARNFVYGGFVPDRMKMLMKIYRAKDYVSEDDFKDPFF